MTIEKNTPRTNQRRENRLARWIINAATKYDLEGCEICGRQPMDREVYPIGEMGRRIFGVCYQHLQRLDTLLSMQVYFEGEEKIKQRKMAEGVGGHDV